MADIKKIEKLSDFVMRQQKKLFGHVIRADKFDLMKQPALDENFEQPHQLKRRRGQPRMGWIKENCKYALKRHHNIEYDDKNPDHIEKLKKLATKYELGARW